MIDINAIKNDEYLYSFIKENNLSDEYVNAHIGTFSRIYNSRIKCKDCPGLKACNQASKGERLTCSFSGVLVDEVEYCEYGLAVKKKESLFKKYRYCDISDNLIDLDLNNINVLDNQKQLFTSLYDIYEGNRTKGLYITGDLGVGKTYLCIALCNSLAKVNESVAFVKVSNFFNQMKTYVGGYNDLLDKNINILKKVKFLVLDDIGAESVSEFVRDDILFRILDYRLENKLTTIFTSNLHKDELFTHYQYDRNEKSNIMNAKRLLERIDILTDNLELSGEDLRKK